MGMHHALMGTVDRRGYSGQQKGTICDAHGLYPSIWRTSQFFAEFDWFVMSDLDAYISKYGNFCANDNDNDNNNNDDIIDYLAPCACARGNNYFLAHCFHGYNKHVLLSPQELYECLPWLSGTVW